MLAPDFVERRVGERAHPMRPDIERDWIAGHAVHEHEDGDGDAEERQNAIQQAADDVGEHAASLDGFTRSRGESKLRDPRFSACKKASLLRLLRLRNPPI